MVDVSTFSVFNVSDVLTALAAAEGLNIEVEGIDDTCYGMVITADKSFVDFCTQHKDPYNFQVIDGNPIRIVRRAINDDLVIDYNIAQDECKIKNGPAVTLTRTDVASLPRQNETQYLDPDRDFGTTSQIARHPGAPVTNVVSTSSLDFVISGMQARELAFDSLYRAWAQQLSAAIEHDDISIEAGDTISLTSDMGVSTLLAQETTYTKDKTNIIIATVLLTSSGISIAGGIADPNSTSSSDQFASWLFSL